MVLYDYRISSQSSERLQRAAGPDGPSGDSSGVSEVARTTGLAKSTCSRILASLDELGIVERVDEAGRYVIGPGLRALAAAGAPVGTLRDLARPYLRELAGRLGESASLAVMDGGEGLYVTQVAMHQDRCR